MSELSFGLEPRNKAVADFIEDYADGFISYGQLEREIAALGFKTTSLFEMTCHIIPKHLDDADDDPLPSPAP